MNNVIAVTRCHDCSLLLGEVHCFIDNKAYCDECADKYVGDIKPGEGYTVVMKEEIIKQLEDWQDNAASNAEFTEDEINDELVALLDYHSRLATALEECVKLIEAV